MAVELAAAYVQIVPSARGIQSSLADELTAPVGKAGKKAGDGFMSSLGLGLKAGLAGVGIAAGLVFAKGFSEALDRGKSADQVAAAFGLDAKTQAELGDVAGRLYADAYGDSFGEVLNTAAAIRQALGEELSGEAIEGLTANALDFASAMGADVSEAVSAAGLLVSNDLAADGEEAFDLLTAASQRLPEAVRDEVLAATNEYSTFFADLGLTGAEAFDAIVNAAETGGNYGVDKVGDAFKELTIRATDMSTASVEAYELAGLSAEDMAGRFLEGGETARGALDELIDGLLSIDDPVAQSNAAIGLFGTPLEDLSASEIPDFLDSLGDIGDGFADVEGSADEMGEVLNDNLATDIESFKRTVLGGLTGFIEENVIPGLEDFAEVWAADIGPAVEQVGDFITTEILPTFGEVYSSIAEDVVPALGDLWGTIEEDLLPALEDLWATYSNDILPIQQEVWGFILRNLIPAIAWLAEKIAWTVNTAIDHWGRLKENIRTVVDTATGVRDSLAGTWNSIVSTITGLPGKIGSAASGMWDGIKNAFFSAINAVIKAWNNLSFSVPSIDIPGIGKVGGQTFNTPDIGSVGGGGSKSTQPTRFGSIPTFADGGMFDAPSGMGLAALHDGERVLTSQQNREFERLARMAEAMDDGTNGAGGDTHHWTIPEGLDERAVARYVAWQVAG